MKNASGKLVIVGILAAAVAAASASWWFRYSATHRAAEFWGPESARMIRDAPVVQFWQHDPPASLELVVGDLANTEKIVDPATIRDVTHSRGLIHLRNALLDDRSYRWPAIAPSSDATWKWVLSFRDDTAKAGTVVLISSDGRRIARLDRPDQILSCEPIASGLAEMIAEFSSQPMADPAR